MDTVLFEDAPIWLSKASATAPCRMSRDIPLDWANRSRAVWLRVSVTLLCDTAAPKRLTLLAPSARTSLEPSTIPRLSLNRIDTVPLPVWYAAPTNDGFVSSRIVIPLSPVAALGCPPAPVTAPSPRRIFKDMTPSSRPLSAPDSAVRTVPPCMV